MKRLQFTSLLTVTLFAGITAFAQGAGSSAGGCLHESTGVKGGLAKYGTESHGFASGGHGDGNVLCEGAGVRNVFANSKGNSFADGGCGSHDFAEGEKTGNGFLYLDGIKGSFADGAERGNGRKGY